MENSPGVLDTVSSNVFRQERLVADDEVCAWLPWDPSGGLQPRPESTGSIRPVRRGVNPSKGAIWLQL
jgi:hypothetical protein